MVRIARAAFALLFLGTLALRAEEYSQWQSSMLIRLNTQSSGANVWADQYNFPILVRLTAGNAAQVFPSAKPGGADLRFVKTGSSKRLPHEVIRWDSAGNRAFVWVLMDTVKGGRNDQSITMFWGNPNAADSSNPAQVFDSSFGFGAVLHLNRSTGNTYTDATGKHNGIGSGAIGDTDGPLDRARYLHCAGTASNYLSGDSITIAGMLGNPPSLTLSAWVRVDTIDQYNTAGNGHRSVIMSIGDNAGMSDAGLPGANTDSLYGGFHSGTGTWSNFGYPPTGTAAKTLWKQGWKLAGVVLSPNGSGGYGRIYLNGDSLRNVNFNSTPITYTAGARTVIGKHGNGQTGQKFGGSICEARFERTARSSQWMRLCYQNQQANDQLLSGYVKVPVLVSPGNQAGDQSTSPVLSWRPVQGATSYTMQASTAPDFSVVTSSQGVTGQSVILPGLAPQTWYYWQVNAINEGGSSPWSAVWSFQTQAGCPDPAIAAQPRDTAVDAGDTAGFLITATGSSLTYQWQKSIDSGRTWANASNGITPAQSANYRFLFTDQSDAGGRVFFHCIVTTQCSGKTVTSAMVHLSTCLQPAFIQNPQDIPDNASPGQQCTFTAAASGPPSIVYLWYISSDGGYTWVPDTSASGRNPIYIYTVKQGDGPKQFRCMAKNAVCGAWVSSRAAAMTPCASALFGLQPQNAAVVEGQTARFSVSATGTSLSYQWQMMRNGSFDWQNIPGATDVYYSRTALFTTDSNALFRCIATSHCNATAIDVPSNAVVLTVYRQAQALFSAYDAAFQNDTAGHSFTSGVAPATVVFFDHSLGNDTAWSWDFGDGRTVTAHSPQAVQTETYTTAGSYTVTLTVSGISGTHTATRTVNVYPAGGNPMTLGGAFRNNDSVALTFGNYGDLTGPGGSASRFVTAIRLWNESGAIPTEADTFSGKAVLLKTYPGSVLPAWQAQGTSFTDGTLPRAQHLARDSVSGFVTQVVWSDNSVYPFNAANGCLVVMHSTTKPANALVLTTLYAPWDTVRFIIDSTQKIDTTISDSVGLWFGIGTDSIPNFSTSTNLVWLSARKVVAGSVSHRFVFNLKSSQFNTDRKSLLAAVIIKGRNTVLSNPVLTITTIGRRRPDNPLHLFTHAIGAGAVRAWWSGLNTPADSITAVRIYYQKGQPVPVGGFLFPGLDSAIVDPGRIAARDSADTITYNLRPQTRYYFGAQVYRNGLWSIVTAASSATDSTPQCTGTQCDTIQNTAALDSAAAYFDTTTNRLHFRWSVDTSISGGNLQIALSFSHRATNVSDAPQDQSDSLLTPPIAVSSGRRTPGSPIVTGDTAVSLGTQLLYDTTMYAYVWLKPADRFRWTQPVARHTLPRCPFAWQGVSYNFRNVFGGDTTSYVDDKIRFVTPAVGPGDAGGPYTGVIHNWQGDSAGFVKVGQSFTFKTLPPMSEPFNVWMRCNLPNGYTIRDAKVYRFDSRYNRWIAQPTYYDPTLTFAFVTTNALSSPFALMIDTLPPTITAHRTVPDTLTGSPRYDTLDINDNAGNLAWQFTCRDGADPLSLADTSQHDIAGSGSASAIVSTYMQNPRHGLQAVFSVNDGRNTVVKNISPVVLLSGPGDTVRTSPMRWSPVFINGIAGSFPMTRLISAAAPGATPAYDTRQIRIVRYDTGWVEYSPTGEASAFDFKAGRLFWVKTRSAAALPFGQAYGIPLSDTIAITLAPRSWTDFAIPFSFDMRVGDVVDATALGLPPERRGAADSLEFYRWSDNGGGYTCEPLYGVPTRADPTALMSCKPTGSGGTSGFTVYNPGNQPMQLRFPPTCDKISVQAAPSAKRSATAAAASGTSGWSIAVLPRTVGGIPLTTVLCGYLASLAAAPTFYALPPTLQTSQVGVCEGSRLMRGHQFNHRMDSGGCAFLLAIRNDSKDREEIGLRLQLSGDLPTGARIALIDPATGDETPQSANGYSVPVPGQGTVLRRLLVGSEGYIASAAQRIPRLALTRVYPNPLRGTVHLGYTLPAGQIGKVAFRLVDLRGRTVWQATLHESSVAGGSREYLWNGSRALSAGVYLLRMTVTDPQGHCLGSFERKLTCLE